MAIGTRICSLAFATLRICSRSPVSSIQPLIAPGSAEEGYYSKPDIGVFRGLRQLIGAHSFISEGTYHDHVVLGGGLAGDLGEGVGLEAGVEDGIGDLIRKLVGVALVDGLGGEKEVALFADHGCKLGFEVGKLN